MNRNLVPANRRALARCLICSMFLMQTLAVRAQTKPATTAPLPRPLLLATGSADRFWIAQFDTASKTRTRTFLRGQVLPTGDWQDLGSVPGIVTALADMRGELALLLEDGTWKRVGIGTSMSSGVSVPGTGPILAWGSATHALLAVRAVAGGKAALAEPAPPVADPDLFAPPATRPATRAASTAPTTRPATTRSADTLVPVLFQFERGRWHALADVPARADAIMALGALNQQPVVAISDGGDAITTFAWVNARWSEWGKVRIGHGRFQLCGAGSYVILWSVDADNAVRVWRFMNNDPKKGQWEAVPLTPARAADAQSQKAIAVAADELRMLALHNGAIGEQRYQIIGNTAGTARGELSTLSTPRSNQPNPFQWLLQSFLFMLFMTVVIVVLYRRRQAAAKNEDKDQED